MDVERLRRYIERSEHIEADLARIIAEIAGEDLAAKELFKGYAQNIRSQVAAHESHPEVKAAVEDLLRLLEGVLTAMEWHYRSTANTLNAVATNERASAELAHEFLQYVERRQRPRPAPSPAPPSAIN